MAEEKTKKARFPPWHGPHGSSELRVLNSLTGTKVPFVPSSGRRVKWYVCGPTVYDTAHLGHARAYITFDILRRIMQDYMGYEVEYVLNITDVDDKIILRARRNHLLAEFERESLARKLTPETLQDAALLALGTFAEMREELASQLETGAVGRLQTFEEADETYFRMAQLDDEALALRAVVGRIASGGKLGEDFFAPLNDVFEGRKEWAQKRAAALGQSTSEATAQVAAAKRAFLETQEQRAVPDDLEERFRLIVSLGRTALGERLDRMKGGGHVTDHAIFRAHSQRHEGEYFEDMRALGIRDPDAVTRVSEYIEKITAYVQQIAKNGFAYESLNAVAGEARSVYFDTAAFAKTHNYPKLAPRSATREAAGAERSSEKKNGADFALWKASKAGEPFWPSPWGNGRPGWHIECSTMASDILGDTIDVHGGGEDLKFPHHDNELAQAEAYLGRQQWVNHFWHAGHLHIEGRKMSKSLRNFVTIREALQTHSARHIRIAFLMQPWDKRMNYSVDTLKSAAGLERTFREFFLNVDAALRTTNSNPAYQTQLWNTADRTFAAKITEIQEDVHSALHDNFNFPKALGRIADLVTETNKYRSLVKAAEKAVLLQRASKFVERLLRVFGVILDGETGLGRTTCGPAAAADTGNREPSSSRVLDILTEFRAQIRAAAQQTRPHAEILRACDVVRDVKLPEIGVRLEDVAMGSAQWKFDDPTELLRQREEKHHVAAAQALQKLKNQLSVKEKALEKWQRASLPPSHTSLPDGPAGLPTHGPSKSTLKAARKTLDKQSAAHKEYQAKLATEPDFLDALEAEIEQLRRQLAN